MLVLIGHPGSAAWRLLLHDAAGMSFLLHVLNLVLTRQNLVWLTKLCLYQGWLRFSWSQLSLWPLGMMRKCTSVAHRELIFALANACFSFWGWRDRVAHLLLWTKFRRGIAWSCGRCKGFLTVSAFATRCLAQIRACHHSHCCTSLSRPWLSRTLVRKKLIILMLRTWTWACFNKLLRDNLHDFWSRRNASFMLSKCVWRRRFATMFHLLWLAAEICASFTRALRLGHTALNLFFKRCNKLVTRRCLLNTS